MGGDGSNIVVDGRFGYHEGSLWVETIYVSSIDGICLLYSTTSLFFTDRVGNVIVASQYHSGQLIFLLPPCFSFGGERGLQTP